MTGLSLVLFRHSLSLSLTKIILSVSALSKIEVVRPDLVYVQRDLRFFSFDIGVFGIFKLSAMSTSICFHFCTLFVWNIIFLGWNCSLLKYYACIWSLMAKSGVLFAELFFLVSNWWNAYCPRQKRWFSTVFDGLRLTKKGKLFDWFRTPSNKNIK